MIRRRARCRRPMHTVLALLLLVPWACARTGPAPAADPAPLRERVADIERAFAATMAARDHAAFQTFLSEEAVFVAGTQALRGKKAVAEAWKPFFQGETAPFSWEPDQVEVLDSGTLALSTGPVYDPSGRVTGRFQSIWRQEAPGEWRIVFDRGTPVCEAAPAT